MDGVTLFGLNGSSLVNGVTNHVHNPAQSLGADGNTDGGSSVDNLLTADKSFGGVHGDGPHSGVSEMLGDFEDKSVLNTLDFKGVEDGGDLSFELHVDDGADDLSGTGSTCEIWPFLRAAALTVEKSEVAPLMRLRINIIR